MKYDIILAGVGGQGILTMAYLIDNTAVAKGLFFKQAEVHGMAQRGGAVYSHLRVSDREIMSDLVPEGKADMILSLEPLEVQRYLQYLSSDGIVVVSSQPFKNIPDYPEDNKVYEALFKIKNCVLVDAAAIAARAKVPMAQNIAMVGVATPFLPFDIKDFEPHIEALFRRKGADIVQSNITALQMGYKVGQFYKELIDQKVPPHLSYPFVSKLDPATVDPSSAKEVAKKLLADPKTAEEKSRTI